MKDSIRYLSPEAFSELSDKEKQSYYEELGERKKTAFTAADISELAMAYTALGKYLSAEHFADELNKAAEEQRKEDEEYARKRKKSGLIVIGAIVAGVVLIAVLIAVLNSGGSKKSDYNEAVALYREGRYTEALEIFERLGNYEDSKLYIISINGAVSQGTVLGQAVKVGDTISFGNWDNGDGDEKVKWLVISVDSEKKRAFVVSEEILEAMAYGNNDSWRDSSLRAWLNNEFLNSAFSAEEKALIVNNLYEDYGENEDDIISASTDRITLLSRYECEKYLSEVMDRKAEGAGQTEWWLRTSLGDGKIIYVADNGRIASLGGDMTQTLGVRPAMWIEFDQN